MHSYICERVILQPTNPQAERLAGPYSHYRCDDEEKIILPSLELKPHYSVPSKYTSVQHLMTQCWDFRMLNVGTEHSKCEGLENEHILMN